MNKAYIIPHTHWDREWRYPIWKNRMLLIEFMDELLDILEKDEDYHCFLMDGQAVPIEDYLEVKPENKEKIETAVKSGRIAVGPWYTLPDLYPVDGECLVRNLVIGMETAKKYGEPLKVGYNSFGWGQIAQFPQIYAGFGIDFIICAKKVCNERAPESEFMWESPDGTRILTSRLGEHARANFYFNTYLYAKYGINCLSSDFKYSPKLSGNAIRNADIQFQDEDVFVIESDSSYDSSRLKQGMEDAWKATDDTVAKENRLFLNGTDFSTPHRELSQMLKDLNNLSEDTQYVNCRLEEYSQVLHQTIKKDKLRIIKGELRDGPSCDCSGNALASRIYLKQLNKKAQNIILHKAEPMLVMNAIMGGDYQKGFLDLAWKYLLKAHPHDSINGVTQDKTADDVEYRLNQAVELGQTAYNKGVEEIVKQINLTDYEKDDILLVIFNPHSYKVTDVIKTSISTPQADSIWSLNAYDQDKTPLVIQEIARDEKTHPVHDLNARPWPYAVDRHQLYLETGEIPAMGYKVIKFQRKDHFERTHYYWMKMRKTIGDEIAKTGNILENEYLKVVINTNGTFKLLDKEHNRSYDNLHYFEDTGDVGNYWAYYPPYHNKTYTTLTSGVNTWVEDNGPLCATIGIEYKLELPVCGYESKFGVKGSGKRSDETREFVITSKVTLKKGSKKVDICTSFVNNVENHRLRIAFPTGIKSNYAYAAGHFNVDVRPVEPLRDKENEYWPEMQTLPMQGFLDINDKEKGLALLNNCLTEYEVSNDDSSTVFLTLFRAMGNMIVTWWEAVGEFPDQTGSQMQRNMKYEYSIYPHEGSWEDGEVYSMSENLNVSLSEYQLYGTTKGNLPDKHSFMELNNKNLIVSAFKKAQKKEGFILRLYNPTDEIIEDIIKFGFPIQSAWLCNLNEERESCIRAEGQKIHIQAGAHKIITIEITTKNDN